MYKVTLAMLLPSLAAMPLAAQTFPCQVKPSELLELASPVVGVVAEVHANRGKWVKQGELLVKLDDRVEQARVAYSKSRAQSNGSVSARKAKYEFEQRQIERNKEVMAQNIISAQAADEIRTGHVIAKMELQEAEEQQAIFRDELAMANAELALKRIHSPIDGVVVERFVGLGEQVRDEPIIKIAKVDVLYVEASVPVEQYGQFKTGDKATVSFTLPGLTDKQLPITLIDPVADPRSHTFNVRLELQNKDFKIPAGSKCLVKIDLIESKSSANDDSLSTALSDLDSLLPEAQSNIDKHQ
ncbi:efflux RND transporter periplasmic adaptor subunit [Vibrio genomosp. F10]|uniref:Efflux transporter periplasmic adaptor subunit n=1 Tax=Vibrio genomosp. F10 TaxID=723171 RepID=A0A1B9QW59_9VIBR|nr:efflux RND transporter periplasmic adaptor subunit [Vibrio genomosp. F10]OCH73658.1 efflux transporter periplasmic adaptor subunit [Vibrio genomosp. F10]OEE98367.1 efflux transporter periplasmic adaptor subunit [Vibrio genomosp. F10 str. 9ZC157]OEF05073.1 efflux transporter periplasmic adaptor subunit [Vibrio genomosp. F10 str. 9ZD137]OEF07291.1 efflux transporter periplasmic adaptor subunit [Vibrio genomosp. F10 str. 9ZB36]